MSEPVFQPIGEEAERLEKKEGGLTELDSVCAECRKDVGVLIEFENIFSISFAYLQSTLFTDTSKFSYSTAGQNPTAAYRDTVLQAGRRDLVQLRALRLLEQRTAARF